MLKVALLAVFSVVAVAYGSSPTAPGHALAARSYHLDANPEAAALLHGGVLTEQAKAATAQALTTTEGEAPSVTAASATAKPSLKGKKGKVNVPKADGARSAAELEAMLGNNNSPSAVRRMDLSKIRDAVVQIVCAHSAFNWKRPWQSASESEVSGTGFFVMLDGHSYILTNAHVVREAVKISVRVPDSGLDNFPAYLFGVCYEKDVALLRLTRDAHRALEEVRVRTGGSIQHLTLGDSDKFAQGSVAVAVGYPLGQANLKFSTGILSGYEHVTERLYLQITAPINPGNSGGPLLATNGLVMGINTAAMEKASNVGYAIPSSHIRALLNDFVKSGSKFITPRPSPPPPASGEDEDATPTPAPAGPKSVALSAEVIRSFPYLGVALSPSTVELCRFLKYSGEGGVFVRKVAPRGIAHDAGLKPRDLLLAFDGHKLDRFGKTYRRRTAQSSVYRERLTIFDLAERIEIGKTITLTVWRDGKEQSLSAVFAHRPEHEYDVRKIVEPVRQKVKYIMVGGVVFMDLALNHIELLVEHNPTLINYFRGHSRVKPKVVVSSVLPECTLPEDSVTAGELVTRVNGKEISSLHDLQAALDESIQKSEASKAPEDNWFTFETSENSLVVFDLTKVDTRHGMANHKVGRHFGRRKKHSGFRWGKGKGKGKRRHGKGKGKGKGKGHGRKH